MDAITILQIFFGYLLLMKSSLAVDLDACNGNPLGMESMRIRDEQITASSSFDQQSVGPQNGRLRLERASGAWCPKQQIRNGSYEFLQLVATKIRIVPHSVQTHTMCLRMELYGCKSLDGLVAYELSPASEIKDMTAEQSFGGEMALGLLTDGHIAAESPPFPIAKLDAATNNSPMNSGVLNSTEWVGWSQNAANGLVNLSFHFAAPEICFSHVTLFAYAASRPRIFIANATRAVTSDGEVQNDWRHLVIEEPLLLHSPWSSMGQKDRVIQLSIAFTDPWFFLTEVDFKSGILGNTTRHMAPTTENSEATAENASTLNTTLLDDTTGRLSYLVAFLFSVTSLAVLCSLCGLIIYTRRRLFASKLGSASAEDSFYSRLHTGRLFSTIGGNGAPKSVMLPSSSTFAGIYQSEGDNFLHLNDRNNERSPRTANGTPMAMRTAGMVIPRQKLLGCAYLPIGSPREWTPVSSSCSGSLNVRRNGDANPSPPSLMDINFPPPPPPSYAALRSKTVLYPCNGDSTTIYAHPARFPISNSSIISPTRGSVRRACLLTSSSSATLAIGREPQAKPKSQLRGNTEDYVNGTTLSLRSALRRVSPPHAVHSSESPRRHGWHNTDATIALDSVEFGERIADGKFTHIHLCQLPNGTRAVIKMSRFLINEKASEESGAARQALIAEARTMAGLQHPRMLKLLGTCEDQSVITEYAECGDIRSAVLAMDGKFDRRQVYAWCVEIAEGMQYLESRAIIHGHLSPRSCLLTSRHTIKIASPRGPNLHAQLKYSAPEAVLLNKWSHQSDAWSYATIVWEASRHFSTTPFQFVTNAKVVENCIKILSPAEADKALYLDFSHTPQPHNEPLASIASCWDAVDSRRPSFNEIYRRLVEHRERGENVF